MKEDEQMKMTEKELAEFDRENEEVMELFNHRQPTMDTVARMFPNLSEPMIDDMEITPMPRIQMHMNGEAAFVGSIWFAMMLVLTIVISGWML